MLILLEMLLTIEVTIAMAVLIVRLHRGERCGFCLYAITAAISTSLLFVKALGSGFVSTPVSIIATGGVVIATAYTTISAIFIAAKDGK